VPSDRSAQGQSALSAQPPRLDALTAFYRGLQTAQRAARPVDQRTPRDAMAAALLRPGDQAVALATGADPHTRFLADLVRGPGGVLHALEPDAASASALATKLALPAYRHVRVRPCPGASGLALGRLLARLPRLPWLRLAIDEGTTAALDAAREPILRLRPVVSLQGLLLPPVDATALFDIFARLELQPFDMFGHALVDRRAFLLAARARVVTEWVARPAGQAPPAPVPASATRGSPPRRVLLVPGLAKAGTTFLFDQLAQQGGRFAPSRSKEINHFLRRPDSGRERYLDHFPSWDPAQVLVDASPAYLQQGDRDLAARIRRILQRDAVQVLILLRDPIDALLSHYLHDMKSHVGGPPPTA
jgi:hypothetical protein